MPIAIAVHGATGRMGRLITRLIDEADGLELHAALSSGTPLESMAGADVLVDVSTLDASRRAVAAAIDNGINAVVGTSGWDASLLDALESSLPAERGVVVVPNFSLGSVLGTHLATTAARYFDSIEIVEAHHDRKIDSPSGTAVRTAERLARARAEAGLEPVVAPHGAQEARGRVVEGIAIHALRLRGVVAEQQVHFGGTSEVLSVRHETISPAAYERGILLALRAAPDTTGVVVGLDALLGLEDTTR